MPARKKPTIYRARESFVTNDGVSVARGDLAHADASRPGGDELWEPVEEKDYVRFWMEDEKATAAPGEKRGAKEE